MSNLQYDFTDPSDLLGQLSRYRASLANESKIELFTAEMTKNVEKLKAQKLLKDPIDLEIEKLTSLHERGFLDRFAYRESVQGIRQKQSEIEEKIHKLQTDNDQFATRIYQLKKFLVPATEYLNTFKSLVVTYSIVTLSNRGEVSKYLLVPDNVRRVFLESEIELLATESGLGEAIRNKLIGKVESKDHRFRDLEILETEIASDETLRLLSDLYLSTQQVSEYSFVKHVDNEESFRRWGYKDQNNYIQCTKCETMYAPGSLCKCHS
jgi:hypothetical protein